MEPGVDRAGVGGPRAEGGPGGGRGLGVLRVGVLGRLAGWRNGAAVDLGPASQRVVLGLLALSPGEVVGRESLIEACWGEDPPASAVSLVQARVSRPRRILDPGQAGRGGGGLLGSAGAGDRRALGGGGGGQAGCPRPGV